jgi:Tfp pilus assembly protein PilN
MRELEFLPDWYPRIRRRKRFVVLHGWLTVVVAVGLCLWMLLARRNVQHAQAALNSISSEMVQTQSEQRQLDEQLAIKKELLVKEQIVAQLGFPMEMSRLLRALDSVMPKEMSLLEASFETQEQLVGPSGPAAARATPETEPAVDRKLKVRLVGVSPTDVDLANFLAGLNSYSFFKQVSLGKASDKSDSGHLMREFEVTFLIDLNQPSVK